MADGLESTEKKRDMSSFPVRDRQTDRQTETERDRDRETERDRETDRETDRERDAQREMAEGSESTEQKGGMSQFPFPTFRTCRNRTDRVTCAAPVRQTWREGR